VQQLKTATWDGIVGRVLCWRHWRANKHQTLSWHHPHLHKN